MCYFSSLAMKPIMDHPGRFGRAPLDRGGMFNIGDIARLMADSTIYIFQIRALSAYVFLECRVRRWGRSS